jgi:hypothetical protein
MDSLLLDPPISLLPVQSTSTSSPIYTVISGGTGCNAIVGAFETKTSFIIPISDDGGSSSEVQRVLGGPSIGDIRSRLVRLIPESPKGSPLYAIKSLLEFRLSHTRSSKEVKSEWHAIVEGKHRLWKVRPFFPVTILLLLWLTTVTKGYPERPQRMHTVSHVTLLVDT